MTNDWSGRELLCDCIKEKYDGNISKFLENEYNVVKGDCLHVMCKNGEKIVKFSYQQQDLQIAN